MLGKIVLLFTTLLCLSGCSAGPGQMTLAQLEALADQNKTRVRVIPGEPFSLLTVAPPNASATNSSVLRVYIEGDGLAWRTKHQLSTHPTPVDPMALRLMLADPKTDKLYIARPCQFVQTGNCDSFFWSTGRFAPEVINAVSTVLDSLKAEGGYRQIELVGYSGGATVALVLAAQRSDVFSVRTVSGNLDPEAFCRLHHVSALSGSLNPVDFSEQLKSIPQVHFIGADDSIIPPAIFASYIQHFPDCRRIVSTTVANTDHHRGWVERWPELLNTLP